MFGDITRRNFIKAGAGVAAVHLTGCMEKVYSGLNSVRKPNIILIMTDQQRHDTISASGYDYMITPNLDSLCKGGVNFTTACAPGATCVASRSAIFTGMYPHNTGVYSFNPWTHQYTWVKDLAENNYHCVNIGKMHTQPIFAENGFHERWIVENKCEEYAKKGLSEDEWGKYLLANGLKRPLNRADIYSDWKDRLNTADWEWNEKYHPDSFTGDSAIRWIENYKAGKPVFLQIGFPGPHEPYDPPKRFVEMYRQKKLPEPINRIERIEDYPPQHLAHKLHFKNTPNNAVIDFDKASKEQIMQMRRHYYANITLIDEKIGQILASLEKKNMLQNSIVIFTSDHGDCLGDYQLPYKWLMYDSMTRVPFIIKDFRSSGRTTVIEKNVSLMDIGPTILNYADCPIPEFMEGSSLMAAVKTGNYEGTEFVFCEDNYLIMIRSEEVKMVYYIDQEYGELYDLKKDPKELNNLWKENSYESLKLKLKCEMLDWLAKSNYFNSAYKHSNAKFFEIRWPQKNGFGYNLQGKPLKKI